MKRSGIKRGTSTLKRGGGLQADPETTRAWQDRSRKPLASTGPIQRTTPPVSDRREGPGRPLAARGPIRKASTRKTREGTARRALVGRLAAEGVGCEICPEMALIAGIVVPGGCGGLGGIHERRKRSSAGTVEHAPNLIPACNASNAGWIENNPELARALFGSWLVLREGDTEWDTCGRNVDPIPVTAGHCRRHGCGAAYVHVPPSMTLPCGHGWEPDHG